MGDKFHVGQEVDEPNALSIKLAEWQSLKTGTTDKIPHQAAMQHIGPIQGQTKCLRSPPTRL